MSFARFMAFAMLAAAPFAVAAQDNAARHTPADPTDPAVAVTPPSYESAFRNYRKAADQEALPDSAWRDANDEAGKLGGHSGQARAAVAPENSVVPATPAPAAPPARHIHHGMPRDGGEKS